FADLVGTGQTTIVVAPGGTITPTGFTTWLSSTLSTPGTSSIGGCATATKGKLASFTNRASTTITLTDTGTLKLAGNVALGQYDTVLLQCDGTNWVQIAPVANN